VARTRAVAPDEPARLHLDLDGWWRRGGHRCTVHVTAEEFDAAVRAGLPEQLGPWHLTCSDLLQMAARGRYQQHPWAEEDVAFHRHGRRTSGEHRSNMWVWSSMLTQSHPPLSVGGDYEMQCSYNGFLLVQFATAPVLHPLSGRPTTRDVCVVDAVYANTGELVTHTMYLSVWRRIARRLHKVADQPGPPHGHPLWDGFRWSAAALTEAQEMLSQR